MIAMNTSEILINQATDSKIKIDVRLEDETVWLTQDDYDPNDEKTIEFFKVVQNKLLWASSRQTAAELVYRRADAALPLMGMQPFDKKVIWRCAKAM